MLDQIRILVQLQSVDKVLHELMVEQETIPARLADLEITAQELQEQLDKAQAELDTVVKRRKELETSADEVRSRMRRAESRLMGAKSQREYRAATAEIEEGRDALKGNEDVLLELMERQESLTGQTTTLQEQLKEAKKASQDQRKKLTTRANHLAAEIARLNDNRGKYTKGVETELMAQYDFIRLRRQGVAMAAVREGTCQSCHMQLPPQQFNELQRLDKIMSCPTCRRLIYWADAEQLSDL